jgi:ATP-dependent helicase/nuclease subunit B
MTARRLRLFNIEPGDPFLPRLAKSLLDGALVEGIDRTISPLELAGVTVLVPTRRAARALRGVLAAEMGGVGALLPDIRPLGEFEDEAMDVLPGETGDHLPPVSPYQRLLALAPLVERWRKLIPQHDSKNLFANEAIVLPESRADAIWLARELAALIDEAETEGGDWSQLLKLEETRDLADWWKLTNQFLKIITAHWPDYLAETGRIDPSTHRNHMIKAYRLGLKNGPQDRVIIAAGSTGSIPATAQLLETIAHMPRGAVVLPGLDTSSFAPALIKRLFPATHDASSIGHPQYGLSKLLHGMKAEVSDVQPLGRASPKLEARRALVSLALLPAFDTHLWAGHPSPAGALNGVALVEAANEREEALAIAVGLRQAIEKPGATAALVTPDRILARRVAAELKRFGIEADDSGGTALTATMPGSFLMRLVEALYGPDDPLAILALIKHPLFCFGRQRGAMRDLAENFELYVLRGRNGRPKLGALAKELADASAHHNAADFIPRALKLVSATGIALLAQFAAECDAAVLPALFEAEQPLSRALTALVAVMERCASDQNGSFAALYAKEAGESLAKALRALIDAGADFPVSPRDMPDVLRALLSGETVKPRPGGHARLFIWGTLEARLQTVDTIVLGGLNEGIWPQVPDSGPFLSRLMQQEIALEPPERRIGQSAHDFEQLLGLEHVILSRSLRKEGAPAEAARWLQRMIAVAGEAEIKAVRQSGEDILNLARRIDVSTPENLTKRPEPKPPLDKRPKHFSVTEIETLRRDPYAAYARKILQLYPLEDLIADPGARERGTLFHEILHETARQNLDFRSEFAAQSLTDIANDCFNRTGLPDDVAALWWPRFTALVPQLVEFEMARQQAAITRHSEIASNKIPVGATGVTLSAKADRVDVIAGKQAAVMDYKTGGTPTIADARALNAPQLALEVALLAKGAFNQLGPLQIWEALFVRLKTRGGFEVETLQVKDKGPVDYADEAWERLERLLYYYGDEHHGYVSRAFPAKHNAMAARDAPYDHLARVFEWSATGSEGEDDSGDGGDGDSA